MKKYDLLRLIGETPLIELKSLRTDSGLRFYAKLEGQNPSGSIKDRIALSMVMSAEKSGQLHKGQTIVEASSGNTAIALAFVAKQKGYKLRVVIPEGSVPTIKDILKLYGAEIIPCASEGGMRLAIETANRIGDYPNFVSINQFYNQANIDIHYSQTSVEMLRQIKQIDVFIAGIGTGGTITGIGNRLREESPTTQIVGVEPKMGDRLQGLRSLDEGFVPPLLNLNLLSSRFIVNSNEAIDNTKEIAQNEGVLIGISSGAVLAAAKRMAKRIQKGNIVMIFADGGWKYLPTRPWEESLSGNSQEKNDIHWW
ncbi:MAG: cysteine synthase B [Dehalococcoidia bacterium]|nr:cysteine synthase B [Dehalococcoidia bacterium]|tara:strand:- start:457 stop:1389 length:933 start_codon:yes stop_codon:yes gene_type:complete